MLSWIQGPDFQTHSILKELTRRGGSTIAAKEVVRTLNSFNHIVSTTHVIILEIDSLAKKYINKAKRKESINAQRGRPSWARQSQPTARTSATPTTMIANATKRKLSEDNSREPSEDKRTKVEDLN